MLGSEDRLPTDFGHRPVMVRQTLEFLRPMPGAVIVDATAGLGGHASAVLGHVLPGGRVIALDRDGEALEAARKRLSDFAPAVTFVQEDFRNLPSVLERLGIRRVDGLLADLGISSMHVDRADRGFSFSKDGPLDMRMDATQPLCASILVNSWSVDELTDLLWQLGEERFAGRIARRIAQVRDQREIATTLELAEIVRQAIPPHARFGRIHPATRTFQAIRMAVNDELGSLSALLGSLHEVLNARGRAVFISFHSLEDRLVKRTFADGKRHQVWTVLTKKPLRADDEEVDANPRARSAKLRAVERSPMEEERPFDPCDCP
jgi:16S rRNA (cytosine1402-N4)-methyltransferase